MNAQTWKKLTDRLKEPSTLRGLVWLGALAGMQFTEADAQHIIEIALLLVGLLGLMPDPKPPRRRRGGSRTAPTQPQ